MTSLPSGNKNSYFSLRLPPECQQCLSELAKSVQSACEKKSNSDGITASFHPMAYENIHMTFLFAGSNLHKLSSDDLADFHQKCHTIMTSSSSTGVQSSLSAADGGLNIQFKELILFPPHKKNLVVASFEASAGLHALQQEFAAVANEFGIDDNYNLWFPHCTLGKIHASKTTLSNVGEHVIRDVSSDTMRNISDALGLIEFDGVEMKGLVPRQRWLDWCLSVREYG